MKPEKSKREFSGSEIAIIGMSGRFPGARNIEDFWQNLSNGVESIKFFSDQELIDAGVDEGTLRHKDYVKAAGVIDDADLFDAGFFGFSPRDAEVVSPQYRLFLECAWEAYRACRVQPTKVRGFDRRLCRSGNAFVYVPEPASKSGYCEVDRKAANLDQQCN